MIELAAIIVAGIVILALVTFVTRRTSGLDRAYYQRRWNEIEASFKQSDSGMRLAVIDADSLCDHAFKALRFKGENMGERLRAAEPSLRQYNQVWQAHKLRNQLVHDSDKKVQQKEAAFALSTFKRALKDLGAF